MDEQDRQLIAHALERYAAHLEESEFNKTYFPDSCRRDAARCREIAQELRPRSLWATKMAEV